MKTKLVRPVLVESKEFTNIVKLLADTISYTTTQNIPGGKYYQLILISLDLDEKIEVGDKYFDSNLKLIKTALKVSLKEEVDFQDRVYYDRWLCTKLTDCRNIIATQSQLSPDLINQLVAEYNNEGMRDFEIEMVECGAIYPELKDNTYSEYTATCLFKIKLTNSFVTVVERYAFGISNNPNVNGIDYENTPIPDYPIVYTSEEVKHLCEKSFDGGQAYVQGSHKDFIQTHKNKEEFIKSLNL